MKNKLNKLYISISSIALLFVSVLNTGCGEKKEASISRDAGSLNIVVSCTVVETIWGAEIRCPDGSHVEIQNGVNGIDGRNGLDGTSCSVSEHELGAMIYCEDDTQVLVKHGLDGQNGTSCSVVDIDGDIFVECQDGTSSLISKQEDEGIDEQHLVEVIDPCGTESRFDEILLRFSNGESNSLIAHYSDGKKKEHFTYVTPGNYKTTDGTNCHFSVDQDLQVSW